MERKYYVRHASGKGNVFSVSKQTDLTWIIDSVIAGAQLTLPKSDYILCPPPEEWEDMTYLIEVQDKSHDRSIGYINGVNVVETSSWYRLRKLDLTYDSCAYSHAIVVERKKA